MYYFLSEALKNRFIRELRNYWSYHPKYKDIVDNIQGKYSFKERVQTGIVLKNSSSNHVSLSADNFQGTVISYVHLAKVQNYPGLAIEWVKEDGLAIQANGDKFPSAPGIYYIDIIKNDDNELVFFVDPLLEIWDEKALKLTDLTYQLSNLFVPGTLRLWEMPGNLQLFEGVNYSVDPQTGIVTLDKPLSSQSWLSADYRYPGESSGPWAIKPNHANNKAVPGVVLAFGQRLSSKPFISTDESQSTDRLAVVVSKHRQPSALEYGGKWEISLDFDVIARDVYDQMTITDATIQYVWSVLRSYLSSDGIEITSISMGGETEEVYDDTGDDYYFNASFSVSCQTDWSLHIPLAACIRRLTPQTLEGVKAAAGLSDEELVTQEENNLIVVENMGLDLESFVDPYFKNKNKAFETIN